MSIKINVDDEHPMVPAHELSSHDALVGLRDLDAVVTDSVAWYGQMRAHLARLCRLKGGARPATAFLVAPRVLLTNYHVVRRYIGEDGPIKAPPIRAWFDYSITPQGSEQGQAYRVADDWLIAYSPKGKADDEIEPRSIEAGPNELDYALLRLSGVPGEQRGYVVVPSGYSDLRRPLPLTILQYTTRSRAEVAFAPDGVQAVNQARTRVTHRVNTDESSSGSPVFDKDWRLVALHRGLVRVPLGQKHKHNEAIPIATIRDHFLANQDVTDDARAEVGWG